MFRSGGARYRIWARGGGTIFDLHIITSKPSKAHLFTFIFTTVQKLPTPVESSGLGSSVPGAKEQAVRRASARQKTKEREELFAKYDRDKDQLLNQMEALINLFVEVVEMLEMWIFLEGVWSKSLLFYFIFVKVGEVVERE